MSVVLSESDIFGSSLMEESIEAEKRRVTVLA